MRSKEINLLGGSNVDSNVAWSTEDTVNYFVERASSDGFLTPLELRDAPGLKPYVYVSGPAIGGIPAGPVRGSHDCEGKQFHVMGSTLYHVTNNGFAIPLGAIPGTQRVNMAHNQIVGGNEVIITTGTPNGYVYNTVTQVFARITDPGYPGGGSVDYMDTYLLSVEPYGRYWYWSDQASATSYNTLNRTEAEADPDSIVALAVNAFEVVIFGQQTVEFFYNAGGINGNTFKSKRVMNGHGCAARDSVVKLDNTLFWLGVDGILYRLNGYQAQPISSPQFTQRIQGKNWAKAYAYSFEDRGHVAYIITFPDGETFVYDVPTQATTRLESYGLTRWRASTLIKTGGKWIAGDFQAGKLYELDWAYPMEGEGTPMVRERITGNTFNAHNKIEIPLLELLFQTGTPEVEPVMFVEQPEPPTITGAAPDGSIGIAYDGYAYTVAGTAPLTVTLRSGVLPPGITINSAGVLSATAPTAIGAYPFTLRVTDGNGLYVELTDTVLIGNVIALLGSSTVTLRPFLLFGPGGIDWNNPYQYNGNTPLMAGLGLLGGGGHWLTWNIDATALVYSTDATGTAWVTSAAVPEAASKTPHGFYDPGTDAFFIPGNGGVTRTADHGISISKVTAIPAQAIDASDTLAMGASLYELSVATAPAPFTTWTLLPNAHGITFSSGGIVRYGSDRFLIGGGTPGNLPKLTFTAVGASFSTETLPALATGHISASAHDPATKRWVAGTSAGQLIYMDEADGIWRLSAYAMPSGVAVKGIQFDGIQFVAAGNHAVSSGLGIIVTSPTGETWTVRPTAELINAQVLAVMK